MVRQGRAVSMALVSVRPAAMSIPGGSDRRFPDRTSPGLHRRGRRKWVTSFQPW